MRISLLAIGLILGATGCKITRPTPAPRPPDYGAHHPSTHYVLDLGHQRFWPYYDSKVPFSNGMLSFEEDYSELHADELPAFVVFTHHGEAREQHDSVEVSNGAGGTRRIDRARITPDFPSIVLDGRAVRRRHVGDAPSVAGPITKDTRFLRIRPGVHHLEIRGQQEIVDMDLEKLILEDPDLYDDDLFDDLEDVTYTRTLKPWIDDFEVRSGDVYVVETGMTPSRPELLAEDADVDEGERLTELGAFLFGTSIRVLQREKLAPRVPESAYASAEDLVERSRSLANANDPAGLYDLGMRMLLALGVPQNTDLAILVISQAAALGHPSAMETIGDLYLIEIGPVSEAARKELKACDWYERALDAGRRSAGEKLVWLLTRRLQLTNDAFSRLTKAEKILEELGDQPPGLTDAELVRALEALSEKAKPPL